MTRTLPTPAPTRPVAASSGSLALSLAMAGLRGWDARCGRLDPEMIDLWLLVEAEPESVRQ